MTDQTEKPAPKYVYITAGTKGGVGKSTAAIYFSNALSELDYHPVNIDCDNENPTFTRFMKDKAQQLDIDNEYALDKLVRTIDQSESNDFVIDLKAGTGNSTLKWFEEVPLEQMREEGIKVFLLGCLTSDPDSVKTFLFWTGELQDRVNYILVFNEKEGCDFSVYDMNAVDFEQQGTFPKIYIPRLHEIYVNGLNRADTTLQAHLEEKQPINEDAFIGRVPQARLFRYYRKVIDQIIEVVKHE